MTKLIRFDEDHFGYLSDADMMMEEADYIGRSFEEAYPGKRIIVMRADEFIDLTGQYEIVPIPDTPVEDRPGEPCSSCGEPITTDDKEWRESACGCRWHVRCSDDAA